MTLKVRKLAPYFHGQAVVDGKIKEITLHDYQGQYLVLLFYPMDFTYVSPTEILAFSDRSKEFHKCNCSIVGISTDSEFTHLAWMKLSREEGGLGGIINVALLSDKSMKISRDYGVLDRETGISHRGLYIIDSKSILRHITINDLEVGRSVDETLRLIKAFQFTDKYIKVCPVDWKPGDRGLRPDPLQTGRYFEGYFGVSRGKSSVQIKDDQSCPIEEKECSRKTIKEEGVVGSHSAPSNSISLQAKAAAITKGKLENSTLSQPKSMVDSSNEANLKVYPREFNSKLTTDSFTSTMNYCQIDSPHDDVQRFEKDVEVAYENSKANRSTKKENRSYKVYNTTLPTKGISKVEQQRKLPSNIQTISKSDTTQKYNYQDSQEIPKIQANNINNDIINADRDENIYLQDLNLKSFIYNYYNANESVNPNQEKSISFLRDNSLSKPHRYESKNENILKYNERIAKDIESRQGNQDKRESASFTKPNRKFKAGFKELETVKDVNYHPLNDVLNVKAIRTIKNGTPVIVNRANSQKDPAKNDKQRKYIPNQTDEYDEVKRYLDRNNEQRQYNRMPQDNAREYIPKQKPIKGQSDVTSQSSKEDFQQRKFNRKRQANNRNYTESLNESILPNQREQDGIYQRDLSKNIHSSSQHMLESPGGTMATGKGYIKSNLKRVSARPTNVNSNFFNTIREETTTQHRPGTQGRHMTPQFTTDNYNKGRNELGPVYKNWDEKPVLVSVDGKRMSHELNFGLGGHLIM